MRYWALLAFYGALVGCAAQTAVTPIGPDTYLVARQGWIATESVAKLKSDAFGEANAFCSAQGRALQPISSKDTPGNLGRNYPEAELQFRCLKPGDPELQRPTFQKTPDIVIQNR